MKTLISLAVLMAGLSAQAGVNLEWQLEGGPYRTGETVRVGLYAVSDAPELEEPFAAAWVLVFWDASVLRLKGVDDNGPYEWMYSGFPNDSGGDGLNNTFDDGNAGYQAWANFEEFPVATPQGLLMTTFEYEARASSPGTKIEIRAVYGNYSETIVFDDKVPGRNIVNKLGSLVVEILDQFKKGDMNCDGKVDFDDINPFVIALRDPAAYKARFPNCNILNGDINGDGKVNFDDINPFVGLLRS